MSTSLDPGLLEAARRIDDLRARGRAAFEQADRIESALQAAQEQLRVALGTMEVDVAPQITPPPVTRARPVATAEIVTEPDHATVVAPPSPDGIAGRIRVQLSERSLTASELAEGLGLPLRSVESMLADLRRAGQVYKFEEDDAYTWKIGNVSAEERRLFVVRMFTERHITRHQIKLAMGFARGDKQFSKNVDNTIMAVRETYPVHMTKNSDNEAVFWLVKGKGGFVKPDKSMDGRLEPPAREGGKKKPHK